MIYDHISIITKSTAKLRCRNMQNNISMTNYIHRES